MKRMTYFVMALALVLGFTQCKKEQIEPQGEQVRITLNVDNGGNNGSRAEVVPPSVDFETGDEILVASNGHYVGTLTYNGTNFSGDITDPVVGEPLYFYFLGNKQGTLTVGDEGCIVDISDQTNYPHLPVISMGVSIDRSTGETVTYPSANNEYEAQLHNKASLIKFDVTTTSNSPICITGMKNQVTVDFDYNAENEGFSYGKVSNEGIIKLKGGSGTNERWAIVLQQDALSAGAAGSAYTEDGALVGARAAVPAITMNQFIDENRPMTVSSQTPLTIEAITAGTVTVQTAPSGMKYSKNGEAMKEAQTYPSITVAVGDKVRFYGNGTSITSYSSTKIGGSGEGFQCKAYGNIMSLVDETGYATATTLSSGNAFYGFFQNNSSLTDASGLLLPATTLTSYCYSLMFQNCTNLTAAPAMLPAETLAERCYFGMFKGCTLLATAPAINATTLAKYCCGEMFRSCTNLETAPMLSAETLDEYSYNLMFRDCSKLSSVTCLATNISANNCIKNWLYGAGTSATSKTLYVKSTMGSASWNNANFTVSATL